MTNGDRRNRHEKDRRATVFFVAKDPASLGDRRVGHVRPVVADQHEPIRREAPPALAGPTRMAVEPLGLTADAIRTTQRRVERALVAKMADIYTSDDVPEAFNPRLKEIERVASYFDYDACGISVVARARMRENPTAKDLLRRMLHVLETHEQKYVGRRVDGVVVAPPRRVLTHVALAYETIAKKCTPDDHKWFRGFIERNVPKLIAHHKNFQPGRTDLHLTTNNHDAMAMQALYHCGRVLGRDDWTKQAVDFAERLYESGHPDGYFEEHTNEAREGGPSLLYTPLTAGALFDVLGPRPKLNKAGETYRAFVDVSGARIPIADERSNSTSTELSYGAALHTTSPRGRQFLLDLVGQADFTKMRPMTLAVLHHELGAVVPGPCAVPENRSDGARRLSLPLGVVRRHGFTAGLCALRALNRETRPKSHYAMDQQNALYLSHPSAGVILPGFKGKNDPRYSTFSVGDDAYPVATGTLSLTDDSAEAEIPFGGFTGTAQWSLTEAGARLTLRADTNDEIETTLPVINEKWVHTDAPYDVVTLAAHSPYTKGADGGALLALHFRWKNELVVDFHAP